LRLFGTILRRLKACGYKSIHLIGMGVKMSEELKEKILKYLGTVSQARNKEVSKAVGEDKGLVDKMISELAKDGKIEYRSFGGITYIALGGKSEG
jgi:Mn-dependent DtxR family transcriptional regulator